MASVMYSLAKAKNMAMMITRCADFVQVHDFVSEKRSNMNSKDLMALEELMELIELEGLDVWEGSHPAGLINTETWRPPTQEEYNAEAPITGSDSIVPIVMKAQEVNSILHAVELIKEKLANGYAVGIYSYRIAAGGPPEYKDILRWYLKRKEGV